ncbi:unnamed protein product [Bursaphelenchus okinawaensis]|uniref:Ribosome maturation protein SBDS n=1 Tax=Bursaphelenchus okinawaensis TaxID=465554 RepID=A0A811KKJ0_9BILA|nr:unnamed protein product [Bursaphelenchus okinawaensis]CAG9106538.1 unnamed protein product [Bursaphelenchus okinawaensis]
MIKTPTNVKLLTNVAVVRLKRCGKRFEVACYKNKVLNWRNGTEKNIDEVLQMDRVFTNVQKGEVAKKDDLQKAFETTDQLAVCKIILEKGDLQIGEKERQHTTESTYKEIATLISQMTINTETKRPFPIPVIEKGLKESHFAIKQNRQAKQQALEAITKLKQTMNIDRAQMRVRVCIKHKEAKNAHSKLKQMFGKVEVEDWEDGNLEMVGLVDPGKYKELVELARLDKKNPGEVELLSLKVVNDEEVEIS